MTESIDSAIPLDTSESVEWTGRPRITTILPAVVVGLLLAGSGIAASVLGETPLFLIVVPFAVAIPAWQYVALQGVQYVVTDDALYMKRGVVTRSVTQANLETVQNSSFKQDITGSIFGYGAVTFEIAGGDDLSFRAIDDPRSIRGVVDRAASTNDGLRGSGRPESSIPGNLTQWQQIRDEVRAIRSSLEQ
jgi:uncharacterized membrane protein YdbT with pleckstrin-like domain